MGIGKEESAKVDTNVELRSQDFVHLHNHTHYSVLDGMTKVDELITKTKEFGMTAVAITDHGTMSGVLDVYKTAKASGVKPILGIETYLASRKHTDKDPQFDKTRYHLTLLAMNNQGYKNLMMLSTIANVHGYYYKPRIDHELMEKYSEGVICLSGCGSSEIAMRLRSDDYKGAIELAKWHKSVYGDRFYLEMQDHGHPKSPAPFKDQTVVNNGLAKISKELDIPLVVTCDGHYLNFEDRQAHEILLCVGTGSYLSDERRMSLKDFELYLTDPIDIINRWGSEFPDAVRNSRIIADRCNVDITLGQILIPEFPVPENETEKSYLTKLVYRGALNRYLGIIDHELSVEDAKAKLPADVVDRLLFEFEVIEKMHYSGYFLIVQDFINWGKNKGIVFGPGRGSAAGSIIAYCLNITEIDPLKYDLLFERFLNPDRISMPDIDIDIQDDRRDEVVEYCINKYGDDRVANIVTFGTMAARGAVRDVARVLEVPYSEADRLSKMIPSLLQGRHIPLTKSVKEDPDLKKEYETNPRSKEIIDYAMRLEGTIRSHGVHACGVVIAPDKLVNYLPLERAQKGVIATQFPMGQVEEIGLLKMDFLGLSNLSIINNALRIIRKVYKQEIKVSDLPLNDSKTYELFQRGDTTGVFQLESSGMKKYLKELAPTEFEDIVAMVALYRPGPMQFIDSFIKRKHGEEKITYLHPKMEASLSNTYGILVYQEQFMQISKDLAGFTGGQADTLRKAVGKKKLDLMAEIKPMLVEGAVKNSGMKRELVELFWSQLEEFANYCFNKSHAACYGLIAYWTAYLKAHYPSAFMAALMTNAKDDTDRLALLIGECKRSGLEVLAPDINESFVEFAIVPGTDKIRFGMAAVKGVGEAIVEEVLEARKDGPFKSIADFAKRMAGTKFNKKAWDALIKTGAFDEFGSRDDLLANLEKIQSYMSKTAKDKVSGQADLFGGLSASESVELDIIPTQTPTGDREKLLWERELLGLYISAHPLDKYEKYISEQTVEIGTILSAHEGKRLSICGTITRTKEFITKKNDKMAFVGVENKTDSMDVIIFPKLYEDVKDLLAVDKIVLVDGRVSAIDKNGNLSDPKLIASTITELDENFIKSYQPTFRKKRTPKPKALAIEKQKPVEMEKKIVYKPVAEEPSLVESKKILYVKIDNPEERKHLETLKDKCQSYPGDIPVVLVLGKGKSSAIKLPFKVSTENNLVRELENYFSPECVKLKQQTI